MPAISEHAIRELACFSGTDAPVTSCYLDVDGRHHPRREDYERRLEAMLRRGAGQAEPAPDPVDAERIRDYVCSGFDRSRVRGVAAFSCSAHGLWRTVELPIPVRDQLVVSPSPYVRQLEAVVTENRRFGVLLADRQRARLFVYELGELVERDELFEELPRDWDDDRGLRWKDRLPHHVAELAHQHLRHAADVAFRAWQEQGFDHLVLGAPDEIAGELERMLHPYVHDRLVGRVKVSVGAPEAEIGDAALAVEAEVEAAKEAELVAALREATGRGTGVHGLEATLQALGERRVDTLLVSRGFAAEGWRCPSCGWLAAVGPSCPVCEGAMDRAADVVEHAVESALVQSCRVQICAGNPDLDVLGRIGALLRY